jgi:hypothetical protein
VILFPQTVTQNSQHFQTIITALLEQLPQIFFFHSHLVVFLAFGYPPSGFIINSLFSVRLSREKSRDLCIKTCGLAMFGIIFRW